jgi:hypothetical protein
VKTLLLWKANAEHTPTDPEERIKLWLKMLNMVKAEAEAEGSKTEMWGINSSGDGGFSISTGSDQEVFMTVAAYAPYVSFEVFKVLDVDEAIAGIKELVKQMSQG